MPLKDPRKTKIVCTIGPASDSQKTLERLMRAGMDVARLNFSHGTHAEHRSKLKLIRGLEKRLGRPVAVIQDLAGPKIRVGELPEEGIWLKPDQEIMLSGRHRRLERGIIPVNYRALARDVKKGDAILLADGGIELRVTRVDGELVHCRVVVGGLLGSRKGVNIPTEALSIPSLTAKDKRDLQFALKEEVDFVALSFVRSAGDIQRLKRLLKKGGREIPVIAKIEKPQALEEIDAIIACADGIMVARGDLGVEIPLEEVPVVQKLLIRKANSAGKPVITATQMLRSMVDSPRPTRAEVTDVANAIWDGTDAVMLSEETATGSHPVEAVKVMARIARKIEAEIAESAPLKPPYPGDDPITGAISYSAYLMSENLCPRTIVAPTRSGATARLISRYRPNPCIVALTPSVATQRRLCLTWGAVPIMTPELKGLDITEQALDWAKKTLPLKRGDCIIITAGTSAAGPGATNTIRLEKI